MYKFCGTVKAFCIITDTTYVHIKIPQGGVHYENSGTVNTEIYIIAFILERETNTIYRRSAIHLTYSLH
jgi:hypothetical protein